MTLGRIFCTKTKSRRFNWKIIVSAVLVTETEQYIFFFFKHTILIKGT